MFALIETNGATHIAINIPKDGADKSLPALAAMLEHNATFIRHGWRELAVVQPVMTITLGNTFTAKESEISDLIIGDRPEVIDESFVIATPEVLASNKRQLDKKDAEISRLNTELQHAKQQFAALQEQIRQAGADAEGDC